jgi:anti-sigma factor RsiW
MICEELIPFLDAYVDQELDAQDLGDMELHLRECDACRDRVAYQVSFKEHFRTVLSQTRAPDDLRARLLDQLEDMTVPLSAADSSVELSEPVSRRAAWFRHAWVAAPLAAALGLVLLVPNFTVAPARSDVVPVVEQTVEWHNGNLPNEVSGDAQNITKWFNDKVDFPVRLPRFQSDRVVLVGARLAHVQDRRAAYVAYEVDGTRLSVMMFEGQGMVIPADRIRHVGTRDMMVVNQRGYEVALLQDDGVTYTITSELPEKAFLELVASTVE